MQKLLPAIAVILLSIHLAACSRSRENQAQGYIEGSYTYIASNVSGILKTLFVDKGYVVKRGQLLFVLDKQPESDAYNAAVENYASAKSARDALAAELTFAKITFERNKILVARHAIQQAELDSARSRYESAIARLAQAEATASSSKAALEQAKWLLQQKTVVAPIDGFVFDKYYRVGEYTEAQKPILALLAARDIKAIFYVNELSIGRVRLRDKITVRCDRCTHDYVGYIAFISPTVEYTPPVIFSNETNAKFLYRVEATFAPNDAMQLHPGQPVYVTYYPHEQ